MVYLYYQFLQFVFVYLQTEVFEFLRSPMGFLPRITRIFTDFYLDQ